MPAFTVHQILAPEDRTIITACEQAGCVKWRQGWTSTYDESDPAGARAIAFVRSGRHGRSYRELPRTGGTLVAFRFDGHQRCFTEHRTRAELFVVRNARGMEPGAARRERPRFWSESLEESYHLGVQDKQRRA